MFSAEITIVKKICCTNQLQHAFSTTVCMHIIVVSFQRGREFWGFSCLSNSLRARNSKPQNSWLTINVPASTNSAFSLRQTFRWSERKIQGNFLNSIHNSKNRNARVYDIRCEWSFCSTQSPTHEKIMRSHIYGIFGKTQLNVFFEHSSFVLNFQTGRYSTNGAKHCQKCVPALNVFFQHLCHATSTNIVKTWTVKLIWKWCTT